MLFTYGRFLSRQLVNTVTSDKLLYKLVSGVIKYQMFICYFLYIAGSCDHLFYVLPNKGHVNYNIGGLQHFSACLDRQVLDPMCSDRQEKLVHLPRTVG